MTCAIDNCPDPTEPGSYFCGKHREQGERQLRVIEDAEDRQGRIAADLAWAVQAIIESGGSLDASRARLAQLAEAHAAANDEVLRLIDRSGRP